jgi:hypothetical protein
MHRSLSDKKRIDWDELQRQREEPNRRLVDESLKENERRTDGERWMRCKGENGTRRSGRKITIRNWEKEARGEECMVVFLEATIVLEEVSRLLQMEIMERKNQEMGVLQEDEVVEGDRDLRVEGLDEVEDPIQMQQGSRSRQYLSQRYRLLD